MIARNCLMSLAIAVIGVTSVSADYDFFFSFEQGGNNGDQSNDYTVGDKGSLWIYWSTDGPADSDLDVGAFIDVLTSAAGVIEFAAAETFDYDVLISGKPSGLTRLAGHEGGGFGPATNLSADFIDEFYAFTVTGVGIIENDSNVFLDSGYNAANDAFEWGRIDFNVIGVGAASVSGLAGDGMIVNADSVVDAAFSTATINVAQGPIVPEPTTAGLLAIGMTWLSARRRR